MLVSLVRFHNPLQVHDWLQLTISSVYSPLVRLGAGPGKKVAICGLGGLGHFAVMFAKALGAEVYVLSHTPDKKEDAMKMGAKEFIVTNEEGWYKPYSQCSPPSLDLC